MVKIIISILLLASFETKAQPAGMFFLNNHTSSAGLLLDTYPGAAVAYSFRKLRNSYAGYSVQVVRSSDNATQNIGFVNNYLDTVSMKSFVGSSNAYVYKWYDQSGNANDALNGGAAITNLPRIINAGVIERLGGMVSAKFSGNVGMPLTNGVTALGDWSVFGVTKRNAPGTYGTLLGGGSPLLSQWSDNNLYIQRAASSSTGTYSGAADATAIYNLIEGHCVAPALFAYRNGVAYNLSSPAGFGAVGSDWNLLGGGSGGNMNGYISELILYSSDKTGSRTGIETNINSFYSIY